MAYGLGRIWYRLPAWLRWTLATPVGGVMVWLYSSEFLAQWMNELTALWVGVVVALISLPIIGYGGYRAEAYLREKLWQAWLWFYGPM